MKDFFKPKRVVIIDDKKWGNAEKELLYKVRPEEGWEGGMNTWSFKKGGVRWEEVGAVVRVGWS